MGPVLTLSAEIGPKRPSEGACLRAMLTFFATPPHAGREAT
jgi:hypothetical protein